MNIRYESIYFMLLLGKPYSKILLRKCIYQEYLLMEGESKSVQTAHRIFYTLSYVEGAVTGTYLGLVINKLGEISPIYSGIQILGGIFITATGIVLSKVVGNRLGECSDSLMEEFDEEVSIRGVGIEDKRLELDGNIISLGKMAFNAKLGEICLKRIGKFLQGSGGCFILTGMLRFDFITRLNPELFYK